MSGHVPIAAAPPVVYEAAVMALAECQTIDDAKYFADKSEALAAWAKIYRSDEAATEARKLKLYAYRRIGELAHELRPKMKPEHAKKREPGYHYRMKKEAADRKARGMPELSRGRGKWEGPQKLLINNGFSKGQANACLRMRNIPPERFSEIVSMPKVPAIYPAIAMLSNRSAQWQEVTKSSGLFMARAFARKFDPAQAARALLDDEVKLALDLIVPTIEWLDKFEQHLAARKR